MYSTLSSTIVFVLLIVASARDPTQKYIRASKNDILTRDYRPSKWITNSAMDVWYGNKSMIDILWREFSDLMYKLTDRPFRSTRLQDFKTNMTNDNSTIPQNISLFNNNGNNVTLYSNNNISNVSLYNDSINNEVLYYDDVFNVSLLFDDVYNISLDKDDIFNVNLYTEEIFNVSLSDDNINNESLSDNNYTNYVNLFRDNINNVSSYNVTFEGLSLTELILDILSSLNSTKLSADR